MFDFAMENNCNFRNNEIIMAFQYKEYYMFEKMFSKKINFKNIKDFLKLLDITNYRKLEKYIKEKYPHLVAALDHGLI